MPLNAQAEIGRVLAIEPEASQADALRQFVRDELGAELMLVSSAYAAVVAINRQTPDVVLFSESVSEKHRDRVLDHLRSTIAPAVPQRLTLPSLRHCDRAVLAQQIQTLVVARAQEARPRSAAAPAPAAPPAPPAPAAKVAAPPPPPTRRRDDRAAVPTRNSRCRPSSCPQRPRPRTSPRSTSSPTTCRSIRWRSRSSTDDALDEAVASLNAEEEGDELLISIDTSRRPRSSERRAAGRRCGRSGSARGGDRARAGDGRRQARRRARTRARRGRRAARRGAGADRAAKPPRLVKRRSPRRVSPPRPRPARR